MKKKLVFTAIVSLLLVLNTASVYGQLLEAANALMRGLDAFLEQDYDKAITEYTEAIRLAPDIVESYSLRGKMYFLKGEYDKAIEDYTHVIKLNTNSADVYFDRGNAYLKKNDFIRARADFESSLRIEPDHFNAKRALAQVQAQD
jgi:tetratricopeptide (TPR) repeat protein